jgi:hypothetical protein
MHGEWAMAAAMSILCRQRGKPELHAELHFRHKVSLDGKELQVHVEVGGGGGSTMSLNFRRALSPLRKG